MEDPNEDSVVNNLTPRLSEEAEEKAKIDEEFYPTTLETEGSSIEFTDIEGEINLMNSKAKEDSNYLSLSMISSGCISNEERFVSPTANGLSGKVPKLNLSKLRKSFGVSSLNSSDFSNTNYSSNASNFGSRKKAPAYVPPHKRKNFDPEAYSSSLKGGKSHSKKLSLGKPVAHSKLAKGSTKSGTHRGKFITKVKSNRKGSKESPEKSWRDSKLKKSESSFNRSHWNFGKKKHAKAN